jgi:CheY-like chemotaxis protein
MDAQSHFASVILCIDDEGAGLELRRRVLEKLGFRALIATSAHQALEIFQENHIDLVLMERINPAMIGGRTLAVTLKTLKPEVPVAIFTAHSTVPPEDLSFADACIPKLVSVDELVRIMEGLLVKSPATGAS